MFPWLWVTYSHLKEELVAHNFLNFSQMVTKTFKIETFIQEGELEWSNYTKISSDDYDISDDTYDYHNH